MTDFKLWVDLDGVTTDFDAGCSQMLQIVHGKQFIHDEERFEADPDYRKLMWDSARTYQEDMGGELWYELNFLHDAEDLWDYIAYTNPQVLTATGPPEFKAADQKRRWVADNLGGYVFVTTVRKAIDKAQYAEPNHILIDDKQKAITAWENAGGIGILHTDADSTIRQLVGFGI